MLGDTQKETIKNQFYVLAMAPGEPISWKHCYDAINIYSMQDKFTGWCGQLYQDNSDYAIQFISEKARWWRGEMYDYLFGHSFRGPTYSKEMSDTIYELRKNYGFYDARKR